VTGQESLYDVTEGLGYLIRCSGVLLTASHPVAGALPRCLALDSVSF
jgi:hypothetical protein